MRYFLAKKNEIVIAKHAFGGDTERIDVIVAAYRAAHPAEAIEEVSGDVFNAALAVPEKTDAQKAWESFKATGPTVSQAIQWIARTLGLE